MWSGTGDRQVVHTVEFDASFNRPPIVQLAVTLLDAASDKHLRYALTSENITEHSFDIVFKTWLDSRFARVWIDWTAMGSRSDPDMWHDV